MVQKIPKELLNSKYRIEMWKQSQKIIKRVKKVLPITSAYLMGSFTTNKKRPADVDFIILLKTKSSIKTKWSVDFVIAPDSKHGETILNDTKLWMKQKYGAKKSLMFKLF